MTSDQDDSASGSPHPHTRKGHDFAEYRRFFQENGVPQNKKGITHPDLYNRFEYRSFSERSFTRPPMRGFSYPELQKAHRYLFQDVWSWAGQTRTYPTGREGSLFAKPEFIEGFADEEFRKLRTERNLKGLDKDAFAGRAAHYVNELNACHPFVEGNGRVIRAFLTDLTEHSGYRIDLTRIGQERWYDASRRGFDGDNGPMARIIRETVRDRPRERLGSRSKDEDRSRDR